MLILLSLLWVASIISNTVSNVKNTSLNRLVYMLNYNTDITHVN